jgi:hypothetical protein
MLRQVSVLAGAACPVRAVIWDALKTLGQQAISIGGQCPVPRVLELFHPAVLSCPDGRDTGREHDAGKIRVVCCARGYHPFIHLLAMPEPDTARNCVREKKEVRAGYGFFPINMFP